MGFAAGAESDVIAYLAARYFSMRADGRIRDTTGSYDQMLIAAMALFATGGVLLLALGRYPDWRQLKAFAA